jgi:hypothetical protein
VYEERSVCCGQPLLGGLRPNAQIDVREVVSASRAASDSRAQSTGEAAERETTCVRRQRACTHDSVLCIITARASPRTRTLLASGSLPPAPGSRHCRAGGAGGPEPDAADEEIGKLRGMNGRFIAKAFATIDGSSGTRRPWVGSVRAHVRVRVAVRRRQTGFDRPSWGCAPICLAPLATASGIDRPRRRGG